MPEGPVTIEVGTAKLQETLRKMSAGMATEARRDFQWWARYALKRFIAVRLSGGQGFRRRTGGLAKSFFFRVHGRTLADMEARLASTSHYSRVHEFGGPDGGFVRAKPGRALAIPIEGGPALTAAGRPRYASGRGISLRQTLPSNTHNFWIYKSLRGKVFLMGAKRTAAGRPARGKLTRAQPWYLLVKRVRIRPRLKFIRTIRGYLRVFRNRLAGSARRVFGG